jgi:hypothetical protein
MLFSKASHCFPSPLVVLKGLDFSPFSPMRIIFWFYDSIYPSPTGW